MKPSSLPVSHSRFSSNPSKHVANAPTAANRNAFTKRGQLSNSSRPPREVNREIESEYTYGWQPSVTSAFDYIYPTD